MKKILIANWKMNPNTERQAIELATAVDFGGVFIAPPFVFLSAIKKSLKRAKIVAQDVFWKDDLNDRAYTGEVSIKMLKNLGVSGIIIGHSERRLYLNENDNMINKKLKTSISSNMNPILCVGESLDIRRKGASYIKRFISNELKKDLKGIRPNMINKLIIAYEPLWAIGTGKNAMPNEVSEMSLFIRKFLENRMKIKNMKIIYGGSVNSSNMGNFCAIPEIDGFLVGGLSLNAKEFVKIYKIINKHI